MSKMRLNENDILVWPEFSLTIIAVLNGICRKISTDSMPELYADENVDWKTYYPSSKKTRTWQSSFFVLQF